MPSGAFTKFTGRNQLSDERTNSVACSRGPRIGLERRPVGHEDPPMDQVVLGVADEDVPVELRGIGAAAIDRHARAGVDDMMADARRFGGPHAVSDPPARADLPPASRSG